MSRKHVSHCYTFSGVCAPSVCPPSLGDTPATPSVAPQPSPVPPNSAQRTPSPHVTTARLPSPPSSSSPSQFPCHLPSPSQSLPVPLSPLDPSQSYQFSQSTAVVPSPFQSPCHVPRCVHRYVSACPGVPTRAQVCVSVSRCVWVCAGVSGCARASPGVRGLCRHRLPGRIPGALRE